jgi:antitoxin HicB
MTELKKEKELPQTKDLAYYLGLNYPMELVEDDGRLVASIPDLPGCVSFGDTPQEALANLRATKQLWLEGALASGETIVEPSTIEDFSGKFVLRIPRSLHQSLDREARAQGVSLNAYIAHLLSERHKLTALETVAEQWALACAATPTITFLEHQHHGARQWRQHGSSDLCHVQFTNAGFCLANQEVESELLDMLPYLPQPPKDYHTVVKQRKLRAYGNV